MIVRDEAELLILGSQGLLTPGIRHLGSVTHGLIHHAQCPVVRSRRAHR
ncbi:universal stress protein [Spirillospora sp. NPDC052269]